MIPTKRKITIHGNERWQLDFGVDLATGRKRRVSFVTEGEADAEIARLQKVGKKQGAWWTRLTELQRQTVAATCLQIEAAGQTLTSVWEDWQRWRRDNQHTAVEPTVYPEVVKEWARRKLVAGKSQKYVHDSIGTVLAKFGVGREKQPIHEIASAELERWIDARCKDTRVPNDPLRTWGLSSKRTNTSLFSGLWAVAVTKGWASVNIVDRLEPVRKIGRDVKIHSNETVRNLMAAVMESEATSTRVLVVFALGFFGCMRPDEVLSKKALRNGDRPFTWEEDIDLRHGLVTVRKEIAKTGDQRTIRLQPAALEWLKLAEKLGNPLPPLNERRLRVQAAELIGFDMSQDSDDWERDGMRKNCATHLRAVYKNDYDVVKDCGNSVRVLLKHYANLHTPESVSLAYWKISPGEVEEYRKTEGWKRLLIQVSKVRQEQSANGTGKSAG